jgi:hypothetical protein
MRHFPHTLYIHCQHTLNYKYNLVAPHVSVSQVHLQVHVALSYMTVYYYEMYFNMALSGGNMQRKEIIFVIREGVLMMTLHIIAVEFIT